MHWIADELRAHLELAFFLVVGLGHLLGRVRLGPLRLNPVIGVLLAGVLVGQLGIEVPSALPWAFFALFLFAVGYETGPQFVRGLGRSALPQLALTLWLGGASLGCVLVTARWLGFDAGATAGLLAGGLNESAALGTAASAIAKLGLDAAAASRLESSLAVAFAVTYLPGLLVSVYLLSRLGPRLLGVDLAAACRELEQQMGVDEDAPGVLSAYREIEARAYRVPPSHDGVTVAALERSFLPARIFVERVRQHGALSDAAPERRLFAGDRVALSGRREALLAAKNPFHDHEVDDQPLLDVPAIEASVTATRRELVGVTVGEIEKRVAAEIDTRGVFVTRILRGGREIPRGRDTVIERGDVVGIVGARTHVERVAPLLGFVEWPSAATDLATVGVVIAIGGLIGLPALHFGALELGLSLPVGVLVAGLLTGWLRSVHPVFGRVPAPALHLFDTLGLTGFLALVGISAGPGFVLGLRDSGVALLAAGVAVCAIPHVTTILLGRFVFGMHPGVLLGVCAGAGTAPAALAAVQEVARSKVPTLGYGMSYALGNLLLAMSGALLVTLH